MFLLGHWRNFEHLEESLSLPEIKIILETHAEQKRKDQVFLAAIQGIDLEEQNYKARYKEIKERARNKIHGEQAWESMSLSDLGMFVMDESEEERTA